ncbi:MAG: 3-dehydroquinate synthase [Bacteroidales bacterium]|nr:3-dehydroquinate synthase [Bacteroidales bacterium]
MKLSNRISRIDHTHIICGRNALESLEKFIRTLPIDPLKIFILVDQNTRIHCLPLLLAKAPKLSSAHLLEIPDGEPSKILETARRLWMEMHQTGAGRDALLINLGGGVVTDLGGFIAAGYKRGIPCLHIPTTLLGQVDAAIGGKTAINFGEMKNQIGFFYLPKAVFIFPGFLSTLPFIHLRSGFSEIIKSSLVADPSLWRKIKRNPIQDLMRVPFDNPLWSHMINATVVMKNKIIKKDFTEHKYRKVLNFGHTVGHAMEAFSQESGQIPLLHGEAVAIGMICAAYLSFLKTGLTSSDLENINEYLREGFDPYLFPVKYPDGLIHRMAHDKKNLQGQILFTLLSRPGSPILNVQCNLEEIGSALTFYWK